MTPCVLGAPVATGGGVLLGRAMPDDERGAAVLALLAVVVVAIRPRHSPLGAGP